MEPHIVVLLALLGAAAIFDLRERRIPNLLIAIALPAGFALAAWASGPHGLWFSAKGVATGFVLFFPLFLLRAFGAGDAKLMMAIGSFLGPVDTFVVAAIALAAAGFIAAVAGIASRRGDVLLANLKSIGVALASGDFRAVANLSGGSVYRMPFAVPTLAGAILWIAFLR